MDGSRINISTLYAQYRPVPCDLRVYLGLHGVPQAEPGPYEEVLRKLGLRHESAHKDGLPGCTDLSRGSISDRVERTRREVQRRTAPLYQPVFAAQAPDIGPSVELLGIPDFLLPVETGWVIRDCKLSLHAEEERHPEIPLQLRAFGYLFRLATGHPPVGLEVVLGDGTITPIDQDEDAAISALRHVAAVGGLADEPYEPVGWSKCGQCGYHDRCWRRAVDAQDVALVVDVDQGLARYLRAHGCSSYSSLVAQYPAGSLAAVRRPWGTAVQRVGKKAPRILAHAQALIDNQERWLSRPAIPSAPNLVMFDLEGLPPQFDELDRIFLWGMKVYGQQPSPYRAALAGFGPGGDREGWQEFLKVAGGIINQYGNIPFVHYHHYERTHLDQYIDRYGDPDGTAGRIRDLLFDLLPAVREAVVLPLPSYSLKVVEGFVGFSRKLAEGRGDWAMAKFIEATETEDPQTRQEIMNEVLLYNEEDLGATWAVVEWLRTNMPD